MAIELLNTLPPPWPEGVLVSVYNPHPQDVVLRCNGEDEHFVSEGFESIKPENAFFHFGVETRLKEGYGTKMVRDSQALRAAKLRTGAPNGYLEAFRLKLVKLGKRGSRENWAKLPALAEL
jgi:hypothetical protein